MRLSYLGANNKDMRSKGHRVAIIEFSERERKIAAFVEQVIEAGGYETIIHADHITIEIGGREYFDDVRGLYKLAKEHYKNGDTPDMLLIALRAKMDNLGVLTFREVTFVGCVDREHRSIDYCVRAYFSVGEHEYRVELARIYSITTFSCLSISDEVEVTEEEMRERVKKHVICTLRGVLGYGEFCEITRQGTFSMQIDGETIRAFFELERNGEKYSCILYVEPCGVYRYIHLDDTFTKINSGYDHVIREHQKEKLYRRFYREMDTESLRFVLWGDLEKVDQISEFGQIRAEFIVYDVPVGSEKCSLLVTCSEGKVIMEPKYCGITGPQICTDYYNQIKQWVEDQTLDSVMNKVEAKYKELIDLYCGAFDCTPDCFDLDLDYSPELLYKSGYYTAHIDHNYDGEGVELYIKDTDWDYLYADDEESMETMCHYIQEKAENSKRVRAAEFILHNMVSDTEAAICYGIEYIEISCVNGLIIISEDLTECGGQTVETDYIETLMDSDSEDTRAEIEMIGKRFGTL